jgi:hypothetical protein
MNSKEKLLIQYFQTIKLPLNQNAFVEFNNQQKHHLERLGERMVYLYDQIVGQKYVSDAKRSLFKDEFRALEWIMWEMGLVSGETFQRLDLDIKHT